jgi:dihydrofolate synthase/folylpolyglutamate synthase
MNYQDTILYMYERLPMFSRIGEAAIKKDLVNTRLLCKALNDPQLHFPAIHVAGTNGKGSVSHMLASVMQSAGYKVGLYTSPHLKDFRERIRINGLPVSESFVTNFIDEQQKNIEYIEPSFFELTVAMAFDAFAKEKVDLAIIETGLGGRLDSTNIIHPLVSVITNIGMDHMQLLGETLPEIAFEKAGIIKQDTPVVIGESGAETLPVFIKKAESCNARLIEASKEYEIVSVQQNESLDIILADRFGNRSSYKLDLIGLYQQKNLITALTTLDILKELGWQIPETATEKGFREVQKQTGLQGRWQVIQKEPTVLLDVAHNPDGIRQLTDQLKKINYNKLHMIIGMVKDKDISTVLSLLPKDALYYFTKAQIPRALDEKSLQTQAQIHHLQGDCYQNVNEALSAARKHASGDDLIIVCGSVFVVGEVNLTQ